MQPATGPRERRPDGRLALGALVFALAGLAAGYALFATEAPSRRAPSIVVQPTPNVLVAVRDLALLESTTFHMERVIDLKDKQTRFFGLVDAEDAILLVAGGDVTAGVDLGRLAARDVLVDPTTRSAKLRLPAPEILHTRLDAQRTYVHARRTDVLAKRNEALESEARREAERTLRDGALEAGILDRARTSAARTVESLIRSLGYEQVEVSFLPPPEEGRR